MKHSLRKNARVTSFLRKALKPLFALCAFAPILGAHHAQAQQFWQPPTGGTGFWNTTATNWGPTATGASTQTWNNSGTAIANFSGTGGLVTINDTINAGGLNFNVTGYNLGDDAATTGNGFFTMDGASTINVVAGATATISTTINTALSASSLTIGGGGTLILAGINAGSYFGSAITITGNTTVKAGVNSLVGTGQFALPSNATFTINAGSTLDLNGTTGNSVAAIAGAGTITNSNASAYANLTASGGNGNSTFSGQITDVAKVAETASANATPNGALGLTVSAFGSPYTLTLSGTNNNYHGITSIQGGAVLKAGAVNALSPNSVVTIDATSTLDLNSFSVETVAGLDGGSGKITSSTPNTSVILAIGNNANNGLTGTLTTADVLSDPTGAALGLVKNGTYTQVLTAVSAYSGGTALNNGGLLLGVNGALGTGVVTITSSGGPTTIGATVDGITLSNTVLAKGSFSVAPAATGTKTFTFGGVVDLQGGTPTITGATAGGNVVFTNVIQNGGVTFAGSGTTPTNFVYNSTSANTYTGLTTVGSGAVLKLNDGVLFGAIRGNLTVNSGGAVALLAANQINAASTVTVNSAGVGGIQGLDLEAHNQNIGTLNGTGNVGIGGATLQVGSGNLSGNIVDGAFGRGGNLIKVGNGTLTLSGANTFSGNATLAGGTVIVGSSSALGAGNVANTGSFLQATGNPLAINVAKNYTQSGSAELDLRIGAGTNDRLVVGGSATLNGRLSVSGATPTFAQKYTLVSAAGGVNGQFSQFNTTLANSPLLKLDLEYSSNSVVLDVIQGSFNINGLTPNERAVAIALDHLTPTNSKSIALLTGLNSLALRNLPGAFDLIAPEEYGSLYEISRSGAKMEATMVDNRLDQVHAAVAAMAAGGPAGPADGKDYKGSKEVAPPKEDRWSVYANGSGEFVSVGNTSNAAGYNFDSGGFTLGGDYRCCDHFVVGGLLNYTHTRGDLVDNGRIVTDTFRGGLYASAFGGGAYVNGFVGGGYNSYDVTRAGFGSQVHGSPNGGEFDALLTAGYDAHIGALTVGPIASFQYTYTSVSDTKEYGSLDPLQIHSSHGDSLRTNVGARAAYDLKFGSFVLTPEVRATWQHEYGNTSDSTTANMLAGGPSFTVNDAVIGRDSLVINAGFTLQFTPQVSAYAFYDGEVARTNYSANNILVGIRTSF